MMISTSSNPSHSSIHPSILRRARDYIITSYTNNTTMVTSHVYSVDESTRADIAKDRLEEDHMKVQKSELGSIPRFFKSCQWEH